MTADPADGRLLSAGLLLAILCVPSFSVWLLLRRGYRSSLRRAAYAYTVTITAIGVIGHAT